MVACAIAIPAVAIFGKSVPDFLWDECCHCLAASGSTALPKPAEPRSPSPATPNPTPELTGLELPKSASWPELSQAHGDVANADRQVSAAVPFGGPRPDGDLSSLEEVASRRPGDALPQRPAAAPAEDPFKSIQQRLRQLGATWYALETWGNEGRFHFACRVSVDGNPSLNRLFQATDPEAIQAMGKVLQDVEQWKTSP